MTGRIEWCWRMIEFLMPTDNEDISRAVVFSAGGDAGIGSFSAFSAGAVRTQPGRTDVGPGCFD
jgi:hypothetical protein